MSGVTDVPFRRLAWEHGAGLVVSEMVASEAFVEGEAEMQLKVQSAGLPLHMVQLAGREAKWMARAAKAVEGAGADIIDINMGCPAKRVTTGYSGSALMRDLDHAQSLIDAVVGSVSLPVTLKMRLGWDENSINAPELAHRAENSGIRMITVHGRTRCQFYKGKADWNRVSAVREATGLPLVVNGDIKSREDAEEAIAQSGADAVMVGRAAYGAPWLPGYMAGWKTAEQFSKLVQNAEPVLQHHSEILEFYGHESGVRQARKHLGWYTDNLNLPSSSQAQSLRRIAMTSFEVREIHRAITGLYELAGELQQEAA